MNAPDAIQFLDGPDTRAEEVAIFKREFLRYAAMPDLTQPCPVGRLVMDFAQQTRRQTVWQVIADELDRPDYNRRAVELLCRLAQGHYPTKEAAALLEEMAESWADSRSEM